MGVTLVKDANTCSAVFLPEQMRRGSFQIVVSVLEEEDFICLQEMLLATSKVVLLQHEVSLLLYFFFPSQMYLFCRLWSIWLSLLINHHLQSLNFFIPDNVNSDSFISMNNW